MKSGITFNMSFLQWEAATAAGLDMWKWESGVYPVRFKERVIAWYNLHNQVELGQGDAVARAAEKAAKKRGKR